MSSLASYREFVRTRLAIQTPRQRWLLDRDLEAASGEAPSPDTPPAPPLGAQPSDNLMVTNSMIDSAIQSACNTVLREARVANAASWTDIPLEAAPSTFLGPLLLNLQDIPGFTDRGIITLRRSWWFDGTSYSPIIPAQIAQMDTQGVDYLNVAPGTPTQLATEGDLVYLMPANASAGTLRMTIGSGVLAPLTENTAFEGIPAAYDDAILYISIVELSAMLTSNQEMVQRAQAFMPMAKEGILSLTAWFDSGSNDEFIPGASMHTNVIRYSRRN